VPVAEFPERRFPPPWSVRRFASGLLIVLAFPGYPIWHLTKYCSSQEGWLGKIGAFIILSPIFAFSALVWIGIWGFYPGAALASGPRSLNSSRDPMPKRRFPPPWSAEVTPNCFIVRDANGQALSYVYYESEPGRRSAAKLLTRDEAWRIAANIAKLPELIRLPRPQ
jgi:hypothetical protein